MSDSTHYPTPIVHEAPRRAERGRTVIEAVSLMLVVIGSVFLGGAAWSHVTAEGSTNAQSIEDHEQRIRYLEALTGEITTDVKWIRRAIEDQKERSGR